MSVQDLRLVGIADDGAHLLLAADDGGRYRVPLDVTLRSAVRHEPRQRSDDSGVPASMSPREVQALIRAGASADEVAELSGWTIEKISRYEGPIIAEREHVAGLATSVRLRHAGPGSPLLAGRVAERLAERGVDPTTASWDAWRAVGSPWTLALTFAAGGRLREARWHFDLGTRSVEAVDDEARWLTGDDEHQALEPLVPTSNQRRVYDVESEGGIHSSDGPEEADDLEPLITDASPRRPHQADEDSDLVASMRERSRARRRPRKAPVRRPAVAQEALPGTEAEPTVPLDRAEVEALASPVAEIDAAVEEAALPQGGPVSDAAMSPDEDPEPPAPVGSAATAAEPEPEPEPESVGEPEQDEQVGEPVVEVERTEVKVQPVTPQPHPAVPGQVELLGLEEAAEERVDETTALADRTTGTTSQADQAQSADEEQERPAAPNRAQRRAQQRRKSGRTSVPSWDDIMFGTKKDD